MKNILLLLLTTLLLMSCTTSSYLKTVDGGEFSNVDKLNPTDPKKIEVYCLDSIGRDYKIIGKVMASADAGEDATLSVDALKVEAARIGADAIINLRLTFSPGYNMIAIKSTGTAVKYFNK